MLDRRERTRKHDIQIGSGIARHWQTGAMSRPVLGEGPDNCGAVIAQCPPHRLDVALLVLWFGKEMEHGTVVPHLVPPLRTPPKNVLVSERDCPYLVAK